MVQGLDIPLAVRGVLFAKQEPASGVQPHSDGRNFVLTCHLGLRLPVPVPESGEGWWIEVCDVCKEWRENEAIVFDMSFTHCTGNGSDGERYVLIIDFWHPELSAEERAALEFVYDTRNKFETGPAALIHCSYVFEGKLLDADAYERSQRGFAHNMLGAFADGGGLHQIQQEVVIVTEGGGGGGGFRGGFYVSAMRAVIRRRIQWYIVLIRFKFILAIMFIYIPSLFFLLSS